MTAKFEVYEDNEGLYRFQLKAGNGAMVADSQAYRSIADARAGMAALQRAAAEAQVPADDGAIEVQDGIHMHFAIRPPQP
jgi:uncharacterized protein YegP (UPF0339 family)